MARCLQDTSGRGAELNALARRDTRVMTDHESRHSQNIHPVNISHLDHATRGEKIADRVTAFMGSWLFIVIQTLVVAVWIAANVWLLTQPFDPFPFILLNLAFSTQAAYAAPLILLAGNRHAERDRLTLEHAATEADVAERQNDELLTGNREILGRVEALEERILVLERTILAAIADTRGARAADES